MRDSGIQQAVGERVIALLESGTLAGKFDSVVENRESPMVIRLKPRQELASPVLVTIFFDGTFQLSADRSYELEQSDPVEGVELSAQAVVAAVDHVATSGLVSVRRWPLLGVLSPSLTGPPSVPEVSALMQQPRARSRISRTPW